MTFPGGKHFRAPLLAIGMSGSRSRRRLNGSCLACRPGRQDPGQIQPLQGGHRRSNEVSPLARYQAAQAQGAAEFHMPLSW